MINICSDCFTYYSRNSGVWCKDYHEYSYYRNICDGTIDDCVEKGKAMCALDLTCHGITWQHDDDSWLKLKYGVAICKSKDLVAFDGHWNMYMKC